MIPMPRVVAPFEERGIYAASTPPAIETPKRAEARLKPALRSKLSHHLYRARTPCDDFAAAENCVPISFTSDISELKLGGLTRYESAPPA